MDTLSHGLWALAIFWGTNYRWWAFLFGMVPDLLSFGIYLPTRLAAHGLVVGRPPVEAIPQWVHSAYAFTHSFVTWILIGALLYFLGKRYWPIVVAPMAHIALDIPTHCSFFPTPFLWPIADYQFCGISWGTPWIFTLNWLCLAFLFGLIGVHEWQKRHPTKPQKRRSNTHLKQSKKK